MKKEAVKIIGDNKKYLSIELIDLLNLIPSDKPTFWCITYFEAVGKTDNSSILKLEDEVRVANNGVQFTLDNLKTLAEGIYQTIEIILVGTFQKEDFDVRNIKSNIKSFEYYLELFDSTYWIVEAPSFYINHLKQSLPEEVFGKL